MSRVHRYTLLISVLALVGAGGLLAGKAQPSSHATAGADLAAEWHLDELDGNDVVTTPDSSGNGLTGTVGGVELTAGRWDKALAFSTQSELRVPAPGSVLEPAAVTVLAWVKASESPGQYRYVASEGAHGCAGSSYALYTGASGGLVFYVAAGNTFFLSPDTGTGIWDGNWHAVAGTFDGQTVRLFVDGHEVGAGTPAAASIDYAGADRSRDFVLGDYPAHDACNTIGFSGDIDEARVYSRALRTDEIAYLQTWAGDSPPEIPTFPLTVTDAGSGVGSVTSQPGGISCGGTCSASYSLDTTVTLTATPAVGSTFGGWSGDCTGKGACAVTMSQARNVTATFDAGGGAGGPFALTVTKAGTGGGTVTSTPAGILCGAICSQTFASGTSVTLHATASSDASFSGFSGDCSGTTCTVQMNGARKVTATFASGPPRNVVPPKINQDSICTAPGKCRLEPNQYSCAPGQWVANDPAIPFAFEWQQLYKPGNSKLLWKHEAYGQSYYAQAHQFPIDDPTGIFRCLVTAKGPGGSTIALSPTRKLDVAPFPRKQVKFPTVDIRVTGIEVTQGTQEAPCAGCRFSDASHKICATCKAGTLPSRSEANPDAAGRAEYSGVTMAAGKFTVVRVYAHLAEEKPTSTVAGATAKLEVFDSAGKLISTLSPDNAPATLTKTTGCLCVSLAERADPTSSFNFLVPWQETNHRELSFRAIVTPPVGPDLGRQCGGCRGNFFTLNSVPFKQTVTITIWPIPLTVGGNNVPSDRQNGLQQIFGGAQTVMPNPVRILPWDGTLAVDGLAKSDAVEEVEDRAEDNNLPSSVMAVGAYIPGAYPGLSINTSMESGTLFDDDNPPAAIVQECIPNNCRPLTSVAHEITHALAIGHADNSTPHPNGSADCGGDSGGSNTDKKYGEGWPPDFEGRIQGVGFDLRYWDFTSATKPSTWVEGYDGAGNGSVGKKYFDYMSYCPAGGVVVNAAGTNPPEPLDWISPHNWQRMVDFHAPLQNLPAAADRRTSAVQGTPLRVIAAVDGKGKASIFDVTPGRLSTDPPTPASPYRFELQNTAGKVLASVVPATTWIHIDGVGQPASQLLRATLPLVPGTHALVLTAGGREVARQVQSQHAPTATLLSPRPGSRVGGAPTTLVRFSDRDADGNRLTAKVYYSADDGRSWRVVASQVGGTVARVPSRLLGASADGRLQVRVSDGFNLTTVTSGRLQVAGSPPSVQIIGAPSHSRVRAGETLLLQASAFDDRERELTGRRLAWYLGKRPIAHGERATVVVPAAGNTTLRLVATDSRHRSAQAVVPLRVAPVRARYLLFTAPSLVSVKARSLRIRVAASAPATFTIVGKRYAVAPQPRTITLRITPGRSMLRLACSLRSAGGVIRGTYVARRA